MKSSDATRAIAGMRFLVGGSSWLTPRLSGRISGLEGRAGDTAPYFARLFAVRDVVLGVGALQASGAARKQWLQLALVCDVADLLAAAASIRRGEVSGRGAFSAVSGAAVGVTLVTLALTGADDEVAAPPA